MEVKNICCIGAGYVGGPTMAVIALKCPHISVTVVDANPEKIKAWNGPLDNLPVYEPGLAEVVEKSRGRNLFFSDNMAGSIQKAEMIFMAVNTPTKTEGEGAGMAADLRYIEDCAHDIARYSKSDKIVIEKSTLPVRTAEKIKEILEKNSSKIHFEILSNPEFLAEGTAIKDLFKSDRVLIGGDETDSGQNAVQALVDVYQNWIPKEKILTTNVWSSELAKLASNAMLAQRISSINSLSAICEKTGANIDELSKAIGMDQRVGPHFLKASVGFGGSCFQKDILNLVYLCKYYGLDEVAEYWHQVVKINDYQKRRFTKKIIDFFNGNLKDKKILILGWAFKENTNDSRESASIYLAKWLSDLGANIKIIDYNMTPNQIKKDFIIYEFNPDNYPEISNEKDKAIKSAEAIIIMTADHRFKDFDFGISCIFDGRNFLNPESVSLPNKLVSIDKTYVKRL
ncbi:MAG: nucleotide sugar dehydrogenase [Bacteroidota bacterium]|nr:nucleotide sugar dehydrogenase [Bacteroidota bacterium]